MKKILCSIIFTFLLSIAIFAQTPTPTPANNEDDVVRISTNLIQVDVTVTDAKGNVINDIKPEEMEIYENGKKQLISNFSFISSVGKTIVPVKNTNEKTGVPDPPKILKREQIQRTIALVVDDLTLSFESTHYVHDALKKFVDEQMQDGDLVAIVRTGAGIGALQQFTSDKRLLYAAIDKVRWNGFGSGGSTAFAPLQKLPLGNADQVQLQQEEDREATEFRESIFATGTLGAINYVVRGMQGLPGRKSVMLLSDGFALYTKDEYGDPDSTRVFDAIRHLADTANRAAVVIYTMDARGLAVTGLTAADDVDSRSSDQLQSDLGARSDKLFDTQGGLVFLAQQTGGKSIINHNDMSGEIRKILDDQSYYLVGYQPDDETFDPVKRRFNKIEVKVNRKDARVRYRSGFFGVADEKQTGNTAIAPINQTPQQQVLNALMSPFSTNEISLHLNVLFANDAKKGAYLKPFLHIDGKDLKFTDGPNGAKKAVFDIVGVIFGDNGQVVDQVAQSWTFTPKPEEYPKILENGFVYQLNFPMKKPGAYQFRVAIRDEQTSRVGSASQFIEVPNLKKDQLTLSSIILDNVTADELKNGDSQQPAKNNLLNDVSMKRFKKGTILQYEVEIYNAKMDQARKAQLQTQIRIFRDGKMMMEGKPKPLETDGQTSGQPPNFVGAFNLGNQIPTGDYVLQIIVTDNLADEKHKYTSQWVQFEVIP